MRASGVYKITNILNGDCYVGSAVYINRRLSEHRVHLRKGTHHSPILQRAWNKYGEDSFKYEVLELVENKRELISREQEYMDNLPSKYNTLKVAGSPLGHKCSEETRRKIGKANYGKRAIPVHRICVDTGKVKYYRCLEDTKMEGFDPRHVSKCCKKMKMRNTHKGYKWEYAKGENLRS